MKLANVVAGLAILRPYMRKHDFLRREGNVSSVQVIFDEVTDEESTKLQTLGWHAIDDWWGFEETNRFHKAFNGWFDKKVKNFPTEYPLEFIKEMEDLARDAMMNGLALGQLDSQIVEDCIFG